MAAAGILEGIAIGMALVGLGTAVRHVVRQVLDPAAQAWLTRCDAAAGRAARGLSAGASVSERSAAPRLESLFAGAAPPRPAALR